MRPPSDNDSGIQVLHSLFWLRNLAITGQLAVTFMVTAGLDIALPLPQMLATTGLLALWNGYTLWRLRSRRPVPPLEIALHLLIDMGALSLLLYFSGGSTNPFVSMLLVPVALGAVFLPARHAILITLAAMGLYTLLMRWFHPLPPAPERFESDFHLHILGMWANFVLSAGIVALFVHRLAHASRQRERELADMRDTLMRNEHIVSAGALAAGMAHALNTPLSTIGLLAREILDDPQNPSQAREDAQEILAQIAHCQQHLQGLQHGSDPTRDGHVGELRQRLEDWAALRSDVEVRLQLDVPPNTRIPHIEHLWLALGNLLDNAADASREAGLPQVQICIAMDDRHLSIDIDDFGPGLAPTQRRLAGRCAFSSKAHGLGLGLVLTHATLERIGATLSMHDRQEGGLRTRVELALENGT